MINVIVNRTIKKHTTPATIGLITELSSPRMEGELESTTVTVELNVGSEKDEDKDIIDRTFEVDELDDINFMEVVANDDNMLLVLEMWRLVVSDVKGQLVPM